MPHSFSCHTEPSGIFFRDRPLRLESTIELRPTPRRRVKPGSAFEGLWESGLGSLYTFDGRTFVCVAVHSPAFRGWVGKAAVDEISCVGSTWVGLQAFRNGRSGQLASWVPIELMFDGDVVTKFFPAQTPSSTLVYGQVETLRRLKEERLH